MALMAAWANDDDYYDRVPAMDALLDEEDDEEEDAMSGNFGRDLFFRGLGDKLTDVKLKKNPETVF